MPVAWDQTCALGSGVNGERDEDHVFWHSLPLTSSPWIKGVMVVEGLCIHPSLSCSWR